MHARRTHIALLAATLFADALAADGVFTYGPLTDYQKAPVETASPTGNDLRITPRDINEQIPADGLDVFLGPDLHKSLQGTLSGPCAGDGDPSPECLDELAHALDNQYQYDIERRAIGAIAALPLIGGAVIGFLSYLLAQSPQPEPLPVHFHIPSTAATQWQSMTGSVATLATGTAAADTVVITITPTPTTTTELATMTTLTADASGHSSGDVLVSLPTQPADIFGEIALRAKGACNPRTKSKRQTSGGLPNYDGIADVGAFVISAAPVALLKQLGLQALGHVPDLQDAIAQASLETVQKAAAGLNALQEVAASLRDVMSWVAWTAAYDVCFHDQVMLSTLVLDHAKVAEGSTTEDPGEQDPEEEPAGCPIDVLERPLCTDCAGQKGRCTEGDTEGCKCLSQMDYIDHPGSESDMNQLWDAWQQILKAAADPSEGDDGTDEGSDATDPRFPNTRVIKDGGTLACGTGEDMGDGDKYFSLESMQSIAGSFCSYCSGSSYQDPVKAMECHPDKPFQAMWPGHDDVQLRAAISWYKPSSECPQVDLTDTVAWEALCKKRLAQIFNSCDTVQPDGVEFWKQGGWYEKDCIHWQIAAATPAEEFAWANKDCPDGQVVKGGQCVDP